VGLQNIRRRLKLLYGDTASISFSNMDKGYGAVAEVRIPMDLLTAKQ
jgi:LytS/YehU family sensor histidine kinase